MTIWLDDENIFAPIFNSKTEGCSTLKLVEKGDIPYLIAGNYSGAIFIYKIDLHEKEAQLVYSIDDLNDKVLNVQCPKDTIFISGLNGKVYTLSLSQALQTSDPPKVRPEKIFESIS